MTSLLLSLTAGGTASVSPTEAARRADGKSLVAYFSRSGNTRVIAGQISRTLPANLFEIEPERPYPDDYFEMVEQARQERNNGYEPPLKTTVVGVASYQTLFLGFPIWGETAPPVIRSFLTALDLSGKTLIPFITHGGYGLGNSLAVVRQHAPRARIVDGFSMQAPQERQTVTRVMEWLGSLKSVD
ncbi:flavodoxin [Phyllobacterium zundukense]|nr:flavodoxin [Phyllobacterium zundukense]